MQGKGIVKFFLVVMALLTAVQFLLILPTRKVEKNADSVAQTASLQAADADKTAAFKAASP